MVRKSSRTVTRKTCPACQKKFRPIRGDSRYCSGRCRQRAHRARTESSDLDREILATRLLYWKLLYQKASAVGVDVSRIVTAESHYVDQNGNVFKGFPGSGGPCVGRVTPARPGWTFWGFEAAGPPFNPPDAKLEAKLEKKGTRK